MATRGKPNSVSDLKLKMIQKNDTHFFVGTVHQHPGSWIIVGLFYPPKQSQRDLFLSQ